jgi:hypothetical protein
VSHVPFRARCAKGLFVRSAGVRFWLSRPTAHHIPVATIAKTIFNGSDKESDDDFDGICNKGGRD